ncbi:MAG: hypothetical protein JWP60_2361 [Ramlibacter sp.]|nr:hypothetical protein [Ramlibacter sp.]
MRDGQPLLLRKQFKKTFAQPRTYLERGLALERGVSSAG